jgi:16S rRNA (uracil1498-N3)-methyltransferase
MTRPRVLVGDVSEGPRVLREAAYHHLARVLRVRVGDEITLFDGAGNEAEARVARIWPTEILCTVGAVRGSAPAPVALTLIVGLLKGEKMDWVVQKATELGVARICPAECAHAVVKVADEKRAGRRARWEKIAGEAARQCGRADVPEVAELRELGVALALGPGWRVLLHEAERQATLRRVLPAPRPLEVTVAVGPEGGFAPAEVALGRAAGYQVVGFGPRILRAETAALAAVAVLGYALGDLGGTP